MLASNTQNDAVLMSGCANPETDKWRHALCRPEDGALATLCELSLVLVYLCAIVIKACASPEVCSLYGFGDAKGVWAFNTHDVRIALIFA